MKKAVFIDKDGTLIQDVPYNVNPALISLYETVPQALKLLKNQGYLLIVISNQSGVAMGYFEEQHLSAVNEKINNLLAKHHVSIDAFYYCPHHPEGKITLYTMECSCRKPLPGLILQAAADFHIDVKKSWMVGDILNDVEAGNRAGCQTILIDNGNETEWLEGAYRTPHYKVKNFKVAAETIVSRQRLYNKAVTHA